MKCSNQWTRLTTIFLVVAAVIFETVCIETVQSQSVCLPSPRLLTMFPMGAQAGTSVEVTVTGENLDELEGLIFSDPRITATAVLNAQQQPIANRYLVSVPVEIAPGIVEAFAVARLGVSSSRIFSIGRFSEIAQSSPSPTAQEPHPIQPDSTVNATMIARGINHYRFGAKAGQRLRIDCASRGIDSKLDPVIILTNSLGRVMATDRSASGIDFHVEHDDEYTIKVHDLTFQGGPEFFYRLSLQDVTDGKEAVRFAGARHVGQYSWPPQGYDPANAVSEAEPNQPTAAQKIDLPCQISGAFYPAADVDCFEFQASKGQQWWIEVASHRLEVPTGPAGLVQRAVQSETGVAWQDVMELKDIASPMKVSTNFYAYDGPPYNGGSNDLIGKLEIPEDGLYRLQLNDLFGGTRDDPSSVYQLVIRPATADFALTGWVKHIELRNGDRNALSKPLALRPGATIAMEIGAFRRDGFQEPIRLEVNGLPEGVTASTIEIPAGQTSGTVLFTADVQAPKGLSFISIVGSADIAGQPAKRTCQVASMAWPIRDHWQEFPRPRLSQVVPLSVTNSEPATITIQPVADSSKQSHFEAIANSQLTIPLQIERRCDFSGSVLSLSTLGNGFQNNPRFEVPLQENQAEVKIDLAKLNIAPGTYTLAFFGAGVAKYRDYPTAVNRAEAAKQQASTRVEQLKQQLSSGLGLVSVEQELKEAEAALLATENELRAATARSQPQDIADIVVTRPFTLEVLPIEEKK